MASCNALLSNDIKTTLAFSSISHMNFSIAALFTLNI
ncbi:MAG: hypothetical protein GY928_27615 [Colwellia sp.]|nr:hypothetical protein [Colwellia sp.]